MNKALMVFILFFVSFASFADADLHLIYVNGVAEKTLEPNMVTVLIESWAKAATAKQAQEQQAIQYTKVKTVIEKFKIKKEDIQTEGFAVFPEYIYDQKNQVNKISGYKTSHRVQIIYRKVDEAGLLLDSLADSRNEVSGVNIQSVTLDYDKKSVVETATLAEAVKNARSKAEELAAAAEVSIKAVHKIQSTSYAPPMATPMYEKAAMRMSLDSVAPPTELSTGQIKVRVEVQMEFEI